MKDYILLPLSTADPPFSQDPKSSHDDGSKPSCDDGKKVDEDLRKESECKDQENEDNVNSTNNVNTAGNVNIVSSTVNVVGTNEHNKLPFDPNMPVLEDVIIFNFSSDDEDDGTPAGMNNLDKTIQFSHIPTTRIHKDHPLDQVTGDLSMIGSLMYLTSSTPDIMFAVCAYARYQVNPKVSHLYAVKRIFRASLDRKSTTRGYQFLRCRLISWLCKKQRVVTTEAKYVAASSCCGQVLRIQNQLLDYGLGKGFSGKVTPLFPTMIHQLGDGSEILTDPQHIPTIIQPSSSQTQKTQKPKKPKRKDTQVPQPSGLTEFVLDEAVHKELGQYKNTVEEVVNAAQVSTAATTVTITTKEITLAQALKELKTSKPKVKWIVFEEPERLTREKAKKEERANITLIEEWDDIQANIDVDHQFAERLQAQEQEELSDAEKDTLFQQLLDKTINHFAAKRNMEGYKLKDLKLKEFDSIQEMFDKAFKRVNIFEDFRKELVEGKEKRAGTELEQEITKKQKVDDDKEKKVLKQLIKTIPDKEEVEINAIPLAVKSPRIVE
nr:hypothetical protein [Tanacetum cinerariifolium]